MRNKTSENIIATVGRVTLLLLSLMLISSPAYALDVTRKMLPDGLIVLQSERHSLPVVMLTLLVKASPLDEPEDKAGTAYLTAKMLMEGTARRTASDINEEIDFIGASLAAGVNKDYSVISLSVLKKDLDKGFDLFSDILTNPSFPEVELKRNKEQLKGTLRQQEEEPSFVAERAFIKEVFGRHPYGRLVEGNVESIDNITVEDLVAFYRSHYLPARAILTVGGDITAAELQSLMDRHLGKWLSGRGDGAGTARQKAAETPLQALRKVVVIDKDITQANIILGNLGISRDNPDYYAVSVMNYILGGGGFASRLMKSVRDDMGLAYSIYSAFYGNKEPGQFEVVVQTKIESAGTVIAETLKNIERIRTGPVSDKELSDAKSYLTGSFPRRLETTSKIVDFLSAVEFYGLGKDYIEKYPGYINSITKEDVLRVAKKYLDSANYVLVVVGKKDLLKLP
jgi:zinc protease